MMAAHREMGVRRPEKPRETDKGRGRERKREREVEI